MGSEHDTGLLDMGVEGLGEVFADADAPSVEELSGDHEETILAGSGALRSPGVRDLLNTPLNPWVGKRIRPQGEAPTEGANIVSAGPFETTVAGFEAYVAGSKADGEPAVVLDYDVPGNPAPVRRAIDEIRVTDGGRYVGVGRVSLGGEYRLLFYFELDR